MEDGLHSIGNVVIRDFELYKIDASNNPKADIGVAHIDPNNTTFFSDKRKEGTFIRLNRGSDYTINEDGINFLSEALKFLTTRSYYDGSLGKATQNTFNHRAKMCTLAAQGKWSSELENK